MSSPNPPIKSKPQVKPKPGLSRVPNNCLVYTVLQHSYLNAMASKTSERKLERRCSNCVNMAISVFYVGFLKVHEIFLDTLLDIVFIKSVPNKQFFMGKYPK